MPRAGISLWLLALCLLAIGLPGFAIIDETILPLEGANWAGDSNTTGGLDSGMPGDAHALVVSADAFLGFPSRAALTVMLDEDYSQTPFVELAAGYRVNSMQSNLGSIYWDGRKVMAIHANGVQERLLQKSVLLKTTEFLFSKGEHTLEIEAYGDPSNVYDLFEIDALRLRRIGNYHEPLPVNRQWLIVSGESQTLPESENIARLQSDLSLLVSGEVGLVAANLLTVTQEISSHLIVVGQYASNSYLKKILDRHSVSNPFASDAAFVREQGCHVGVYPGENSPGNKVWTAAGWGELGSIYAISHLRTHFQLMEEQLYLDIEGSPANSAMLQNLHRPDIPERAVYYNIAYGISYGALTPDNWSDADWEKWVDRLVCSQMTHLYFYLWGDSEVYYPPSVVCNTERNRILHERLRKMIDHAHRRGLKVTYLFSASIVPSDIFSANKPLIKATISYVDYGFPIVCQSVSAPFSFGGKAWGSVMDFMVDIYANQIEWFKSADEFQIWFYDPGGCFCGADHYNCKANQASRLMEQIEVFYPIIREKNPQAKVSVSMWPVWALESDYQVQYRNDFLDELKTYFTGKMDQISLIDSVEHPDSCLIQARARGFRLNGFVYQTNLETGYPFLLPLLRYLKNEAILGSSRGVEALYCMRIEEGSKFPNTFFASRFFWNRSLSENQAAREYARWIANSSKPAADQIYSALMLLDSFTTNGSSTQDLEAMGTQMRQSIETALGLLPSARQSELEWLMTTVRAMELLGNAIEHQSDSGLQNSLRSQFSTLMLNSPSFNRFAPWASSKFPDYVRWLDKGWWVNRF